MVNQDEMTWTNPVKQKLLAGQPALGLTLLTSSVEIAAHAARLGFDFLWIEMEHSPITLESLRNMVLATRGLPTIPFARVPVNEIWAAKRVLDAGVHGVIFPFTSTPELAQQAVAACRYPPHGRRGSGAVLAMSCWPCTPEEYHDSADENVLTVAIIEEARDVLFIGTSDLSFSLGQRGDQKHATVREAIARVVAAAKKHGKIAGRPAWTAEEIAKAREQGFLFFQASTEMRLMQAGARELLGGVGGKALY
jgi:2-keto-3-deoxy-L-rhamnonate aldolase RhmA